MQVLVRINGVTFRSTGWMGLRFGSRTRTTTVLTLGSRSAGAVKVAIHWSASLS